MLLCAAIGCQKPLTKSAKSGSSPSVTRWETTPKYFSAHYISLDLISQSTSEQFSFQEPFNYVVDLKDKLTHPSAKLTTELGSLFNTSQLEAMVQNYPNPFNSQTQIRYFMPEASFISIIVYDSLGRKVTTIADEQQDIGLHQITWNGLDDRGEKVSTGIYIYQIKTNSILLSKKMIIIK